jgi:hypothetical protein
MGKDLLIGALSVVNFAINILSILNEELLTWMCETQVCNINDPLSFFARVVLSVMKVYAAQIV